MNVLLPLKLSASKRPVLEEGEIERLLQDGVTLADQGKTVSLKNGIATLTTHRLLWYDAKMSQAMFLPLSHVAGVSAQSSFFGGDQGILIDVADPKSKSASANGLRLTFGNGGQAAFAEQMQEALRRRAWVDAKAKRAGFATHQAGVGGLLRKAEKNKREADAHLEEAFTDLDGLISRAKDMVALAEKWTAKEAMSSAEKEEDAKFKSMLTDLGISSPVTRQTAGSQYHEQLARQLADFLAPQLKASGGVMALTDVYCMYNRARGTELLSPEDLHTACGLFQQLGLPIMLRRFKSGVLVVQSRAHDDKAAAKHLLDIISKEKRGMSALEVSTREGMPLNIAREQLLSAENQGLLCRDDSLEGLRFYPNFFLRPSRSS